VKAGKKKEKVNKEQKGLNTNSKMTDLSLIMLLNILNVNDLNIPNQKQKLQDGIYYLQEIHSYIKIQRG
jgi:hypothetical protein